MSATTTTLSSLEIVASEALAIQLESAPEAVVRQAKLCILDTVGCMLAGTRTEESRLIQACEPPSEEHAGPGVSVFGTGRRRSIPAAVQTNGYHGDILELNDLIGGHASIGNVTAALALAESLGASGNALLLSVIRGIEATARVYNAVYPSLKRFTEAGMVPVGVPSSIGSAAVAASLHGLTPEATLQAMAIAGATAGWCPAEVIFGQGGTMKPLLFGAQPALCGLTAARFAQQGMTGPIQLLESKLGYFSSSSTDGRLEPRALPSWALEQPRRKLHACCGYIHSAADAAALVRARLGDDMRRASIEVHVPQYVADVVGKTGEPSSANDARFHLRYCVALIANGADVVMPEHSIDFAQHLPAPGFEDLLDQVRTVANPGLSHYHECEVHARLPGADPLVIAVSSPRGSPRQPLSDEDVKLKFRSLAAPVIGSERAARFEKGIMELEQFENVAALLTEAA